MTFGARVLKTGMAVTLSLYISVLVGMSPPLIAAVAAIFTLQPSIYRSWRYILDQLQTNTLGAALAMAAGFFFRNEPIAVGIVCILVIMICLKMKMEDTIGLTLVTVIAVMEASGSWMFALNRFLLCLVGMGAAVLINIVFFPPKNEMRFTGESRNVYDKLSLLLRTVISDEIKESVYQAEMQELEASLGSLEEKYKIIEEEQKKLGKMKLSQVRYLVVQKQVLTTMRKGLDVLEVIRQHYFQADRTPEIDRSFDARFEEFAKYHEHVLLKFEDKLKAGAAEPDDIEESAERFLREVSGASSERGGERLRLVVVASAMYEYARHLRRFDKVVDHYLSRGAEGGSGD